MVSAPPALSLIVGELRTGRRLVSMPVSDCSWSVASGSPGTIEATIPKLAADYQRMSPVTLGGVTRFVPDGRRRGDLRGVTEPGRMFAAVLAGDRVIEAGPIWARAEDESSLTVRATGLGSIFDHRLLLSSAVAWGTVGAVASSSLSYSGLSLGTIAKRLVQAVMAHTGGDLPIVLPADESGSHERTYPGYEMATVAQRLEELSEVEGGPEVAFEPRLTTDRLGIEWVMRVGTAADPTLHQEGLDWIADASAVRGGVKAFAVSEDGTAVTSRAFARGSGTDEATVLSRPAARTDLLAAGFPLLDSARSYSTVLEQGTIDSHARADLAANDRPWVTWSLQVEADARLGQYRPGDWWTIRTPDMVLVDAGSHRARCASIRGSLGSPTVDLQMVPMEVAG